MTPMAVATTNAADAPKKYGPLADLFVSRKQHRRKLLFFSLPVIWCVWQLIALKRVPDTAEASEREERIGLAPEASRPDEIG